MPAGWPFWRLAHAAPYVFFTTAWCFRLAMPATAAWFGTMAAAGYYYLVVRRNWRVEQAARTRYQQAMQFVTHEMRTPLSAIQGSSELISRYALTEEKRQQIASSSIPNPSAWRAWWKCF